MVAASEFNKSETEDSDPVKAGDSLGDLDERRWHLDVAGAPMEALVSRRLVLYAFTGSDWSSESQRWMNNTLGQPEFLQEAEALYHLVQVDFPKSTDSSARVKDTSVNLRLGAQFRISDLPTLVVADSQGNVLATQTWTPAGPKELLALLAQRVETTRGLLAQVEAWSESLANCEEQDLKCKLDQFSSASEYLAQHPEPSVAADPAYQFLEGVFELEGEAADQLKRQALEGLASAGRTNLRSVQLAASADPRNAEALFEQFLGSSYPGIVAGKDALEYSRLLVQFKAQADYIEDPSRIAELAAGVARWCLAPNQINDPQRAIALANWSFDLDAEVAKKSRAGRILELAVRKP